MSISFRDDFSANTKRQLALSVGTLCSICGKATHGPNDDFSGAINNGIAAHITAAAQGGPRYDGSLSVEERKSFKNGIWVCSDHGSLIDKVPLQFSVDDLNGYKHRAMQSQKDKLFNLINQTIVNSQSRDAQVLSNYSTILSYNYLQELANEPFASRVSHSITEPLDKIRYLANNPSYMFSDVFLENIRRDLNNAVCDFWNHFGAQSAGNIGYYDYINISEFRARNPSINEKYWEWYIDETHRLAMTIYDIAYLILMKKEGLR